MYKGAGLLTWAQLLSIFCPGDTSRKVYGFGNFKGFADIHEKDGSAKPDIDIQIGGWNPEAFYPQLQAIIERVEQNKMIPASRMIRLIEGDVCESLAQFKKDYVGTRFCLLHLDVDLYEPTMAALEEFYPLVSPGGVVIIDEYGMANWGATEAVHDYFKGNLPAMKKVNFYTNPGGYFIKPQS